MENRLVWIDLEMTGLDPDADVIIEIAALVTDSELNVLSEGPVFAIHHPEEALSRMDEWNTTQHGKSGLTERVRLSTEDTSSAESKILDYLAAQVKPGTTPLCGNSIWQDRRFLARHMPRLEKFFHYRILDVSTVKILASNWYPALAPFLKSDAHLALSDIRESVAELRYYRETIFSPSNPVPAP